MRLITEWSALALPSHYPTPMILPKEEISGPKISQALAEWP